MILELEGDVALLQQLLARAVMVNLHAQFFAHWMEKSFILLCSSQYPESALASSESDRCAVIATLSHIFQAALRVQVSMFIYSLLRCLFSSQY